MTLSSQELRSLSLDSVVHHCRQESERYFRRQTNDSTYCYELFRRAIMERSDAAWALIYAQYSPQVADWVKRHQSYASSGEEVSYFVNRAFEKMWSAIQPEKFPRFTDLKSLLIYLRLCVHSVMIDYMRTEKFTTLEESAIVPEGIEVPVLDALQRQEFWDQIQRRLHDTREQQLLYYYYELGLKPREICKQFPDKFPNVSEVANKIRNIIERLRRDSEFRNLFSDPFVYESVGSSVSVSATHSPSNLSYPLISKPVVRNTNALDDNGKAYAIAQIKDHTVNQPFHVSKVYVLQAGVHSEAPLGFETVAVSISTQSPSPHFYIAVSAEDMEIQPNWVQSYVFSKEDMPSLVEFLLKPFQQGDKQIRVEFYHKWHWLAKIEFEVSVTEIQELAEA